MIRVIGIGDNVCDKYRHINKMFPGGQALNFSVYCRQQGNASAYIGVFGDDAVAAHVIHTLRQLDIDISHARYCHGENGYAVIDLVDGERIFVTSNKGGVLRNNPLVFTQEDIDYIAGFALIHTSNNSYINAELPKLSRLSNFLSYDFSKSWRDEKRTADICRYLDFGFLSSDDIPLDEVKAQLQKMYNWGGSLLVATRGSEGAVAYDGSDYYTFCPQPLKALDTLGAGDSLAAGFLMYYLENFPGQQKGTQSYKAFIEAALAAGGDLAAKTCMVQGAFGFGTDLV